jgi:predicted metal-dependent hydrolase
MSANASPMIRWRPILAPAAMLDFLVVHELAHFRQFGHGKRFWGRAEPYQTPYTGRRLIRLPARSR